MSFFEIERELIFIVLLEVDKKDKAKKVLFPLKIHLHLIITVSH